MISSSYNIMQLVPNVVFPQREKTLISKSLPAEPLKWFRYCLDQHDKCNKISRSLNEESFVPSRLIDIGDDSPKVEPRLLLTEISKITDRRYVALSHRWIPKENSHGLELTTTNSSLEKRLDGINVKKLSKTFRFALDACRWIGTRYIWIDSFCIIQVAIHLLGTSVMADSLYNRILQKIGRLNLPKWQRSIVMLIAQ